MGEKFWIQDFETGLDRLRVQFIDKNLDRLGELLNRELNQSTLAAQIPSGTHLFYGSYSDIKSTQANLNLSSNILLGMTLGYVEKAPLMMVFEDKSGRETLIDLSSEVHRRRARMFVETFRDQSQQEMIIEINELLAA
ncbi:MAG: hypothetical protein QME81_12995 [bacterium]|nr:hypothetical protein [bacterium]